MNKAPDPNNILIDDNHQEETDQIDQFIRKMKLRNRILKKLTEKLENADSNSIQQKPKAI